tara:strand:+ start:197 stop:928 length:732 start_codon:yes stop_codon:yes gene_type:complete
MDWNIKKYNNPFDHWVIPNFFDSNICTEISNSFLNFDDTAWWNYNSPLENKKTIQDWRKFPKPLYKTFHHLCSDNFIGFLKEITGIENLYPDYGMHGGGLHIHNKGGNLNIHKDYSIHPKLGLQRKLNLIVYMTKNWNIEWGGGLEFWSHDEDKNKPLSLEKTIDCIYNRAVLFDTTQNSWHGLPTPLSCPENIYRKSLAVYYLTDPDESAEERYRAQFVPRQEQENNINIIKLCEERSNLAK